MTKNSKKYFLVICILLVLYNVLVWAIPFPRKDFSTFIVSYIASIIAILAQPAIYYVAVHNKKTLKSKLYGWPILKVGYIYGAFQICTTLLFYILGAFLNIPTWISIVLCVVLAGLALIGVLVTDSYREEIEKIDESGKINDGFMSDFKIETSAYSKKINDERIKDELIKFAELVRYSDPVSTNETIALEEEIKNEFNEIKLLIKENKIDEAHKKLYTLSALIEERNDKCKISKR